jgi:hypothetical protein
VLKAVFAILCFLLMVAGYFLREAEPKATASAPVAVREIAPLSTAASQSLAGKVTDEVKDYATPLDQIMDAEVASMKQLLPLRTDDYMSIIDVEYRDQTLLFIQKRNEWMGRRRFTLQLRYSHENWLQNVCGNPYLARFLKRGVAIQYNYLNHDGSRLAEEIFYPKECGS